MDGRKIQDSLSEINKNDIIRILSEATLNVLSDFTDIKLSDSQPVPTLTKSKNSSLQVLKIIEQKKSDSKLTKSKFKKYKTLEDDDDIESNKEKNLSDGEGSDNTVDYEGEFEPERIPSKYLNSFKTLENLKISSKKLDIKLVEIIPNKEIFNRVKSNEDSKYSLFKGVSMSKTDLAVYLNRIVFDFLPEKSTIIITFIYLDLFLNKTKITLNNENYKK
jgi:hypothetical protein